MRIFKLLVLFVILVAIVVLALANRDPVTLNLLPKGLAEILPGAVIELPLFLVSLASIVVGLVIGYILEYFREHKHRRRARLKEREANQLNREVDQLRRDTNTPKDDVLALLGS